MSFVALFHGLSYHFLSFISSPLSLRLIDGQWLPVWSLLMSLIFQPHQSVCVPFKSHQMRWEPWELRCAGHQGIGSGLIPPQRTCIDTCTRHIHTNAHTHKAIKVWHLNGSQVGILFYFFPRLGHCTTGNCQKLNEKRRDDSIWVSYRLYSPRWPSANSFKIDIAEGTERWKSSIEIFRFRNTENSTSQMFEINTIFIQNTVENSNTI